MPAPSWFEWAVMRVVPRVERGEAINAGVILYCSQARFLGCRIAVGPARLRALDPRVDVAEVERALAVIPLICAGAPAAGAVAALPLTERFQWLVSPRSTMTQPSPVHAGVCSDPQTALERLFDEMVAPLD